MSFAAGFTAGLAVGRKKFGGGADIWQPPADWIPVPEPTEYEAYFLIQITELTSNKNTYSFVFSRPGDVNQGHGAFAVDWGDGTIDSWGGSEVNDSWWTPIPHAYSAAGQYLVKVTATSESCCMQRCDIFANQMYHPAETLIAKLGSGIVLQNDVNGDAYGFQNEAALRYVKLSCQIVERCFYQCYALRRIDGAENFTSIPDYAFERCCGLTSLNFPRCLSIGNEAFDFNQSIKAVSAPLCTSIGNDAFNSAYQLETLTIADNCTFGSNSFYNTYSLYVKPDAI